MESLTPEQFLEKYFDGRPDEVDISEELRELKGSDTEISEEEKKRRKKELRNISSEELNEIFGLK